MKFHHIARSVAKARGLKTENATEGVSKGMSVREGICVALAFMILGGAAMYAEQNFHFNGDIVFDVMAMTAAHPLHVVLMRLSAFVA